MCTHLNKSCSRLLLFSCVVYYCNAVQGIVLLLYSRNNKLKSDHSHKSYQTVLSCDTVYCAATQGGFNV